MKVPGGSLFLCGFVYFFQLGGVELVVVTFFRHKFFMASGLHDAAVINVHDPVAAADRGETVGDDEGGSSLKHGVEAGLQGFSVWTSMLEVASSRIRMEGSESRVLAKEMSCFWP